MNGAKASGKKLIARVGTSGAGDLAIASPIDHSHFKAREASTGINLSVPIPGMGVGAPSLGLSISQLHLMAQYEAVRQQSALSAGLEGFDVTVNGHTHLEGGALTTEGVANASRLVTQTLTHEGISNRDVAEGRSWSIGINVGNVGQNGWNLGASSAGYARIETNERSQTVASLGGTLTLTRTDLQASRAAALKAAERAPLAQRLSEVNQQLDHLRWNEPPSCTGCQLPRGEAGGGTPPDLATASPPAPQQDGATATNGTNPAWIDWWNAVQQLESERTQLNQRIAVVDAKVYGTGANLSRSPSSLHQPLLHTFDGGKTTQELRDGVAVTAAFGKAAYKQAGDFANSQQRAASAACGNLTNCPAADLWKEGGVYRTALHMAIGGMSMGTAGATGNLAASLMLNSMEKALVELRITDAGVSNMLRNAAVTLAGAAAGGAAGAITAFNADANNRQLHPDEVRYARSKINAWAAQRGISPAQAETELARGALYGIDLTWQQSYQNYTPAQVAAYLAAAQFLVAEARREGFSFINLEGLPQTGFTVTQAQFQNTRYLMNTVLRDSSSRRLYNDRAAIALGELGAGGGFRLGATGAMGFGAGVPLGFKQALYGYAQSLDPSSYVRLLDAAQAFSSNPKGVLDQVVGSMSSASQEAAFGVYLSWLQKDGGSLGHASGRVFGQLLVDAAAASTGVAIFNNGRVVAAGLTDLQAAAARRIAAEIDEQAARALFQSGGVFHQNGTPMLVTTGLTNAQKDAIGTYFGSRTVTKLVPDGHKIGRTPSYGHTGIDDLYAVSRPGVDFVIVEYKFGKSKFGNPADGSQMSNSWLLGSNTSYNRIFESVNGNLQQALAVDFAVRNGRVEKWFVHIDPSAGTTIHLLDAGGRIIKNPVSKVVVQGTSGD